jgi:hypothetical protein
MNRMLVSISLAILGFSLPVLALPPDQVYRIASPSITMVLATDGKTAVQGSGVVVGREKVATNCHVVLDRKNTPTKQIVVKHKDQSFASTVIQDDLQYDTCLLAVPGLSAVPTTIANRSTLRVGQRVYAIGAPSGLDLTLTEGLVSSLRLVDRTPIIQTSAAISPGSSGGGLFNEEGELVGITTFGVGNGTGLNFAYMAGRILALVALAKSLGDEFTDTTTLASSVKALQKVKDMPEPLFPSPQESVAWLTEMSVRLAARSSIADRDARLEFLKVAYYEAKRAGLDPQLLLALIDVVSKFEKHAVTDGTKKGYMRVSQKWVALIGKSGHDLFLLRTNLRYGCTVLRHYLEIEDGDLYRALGRYNGTVGKPGFPNAVRKAWEAHWSWKYEAQD